MTTNKKTKEQNESIAWCPDCGDSLETKEHWIPDKTYGKIIGNHSYYCFGCDKSFVLSPRQAEGEGQAVCDASSCKDHTPSGKEDKLKEKVR